MKNTLPPSIKRDFLQFTNKGSVMNLDTKIYMNISKIEKAMSMPGRRAVFSQNAIMNLIHDMQELPEHHALHAVASATLRKYMNCLDTSIAANKEICSCIQDNIAAGHVAANVTNTTKEDFSGVLDKLITARHTVRNFSLEPVNRSLIEKAVHFANSLPSACNRQPCSLIVVDNEDKRRALLKVQQGNQGFSAPLLAVVVVDHTAFTQENEENASMFHGGMFSAGLCMGLEMLGLSSCLLNWHVDAQVDTYAKQLLGLDHHHIAVMIFIGYAQEGTREAFSPKRLPRSIVKMIQ